MQARIYKPAKTAMQSGRGNTKKWVLDFAPRTARWRDPLMGWTSSDDTARQVRMCFESKEEAVAFAERNGLDYVVQEPKQRRVKPKSYSDNFRWDRTA